MIKPECPKCGGDGGVLLCGDCMFAQIDAEAVGLKAKDALVAEGETNEAKAGFLIFATLADVPIEVIEELDLSDLDKIGEAVAPLMGKSGVKALADLKVKRQG